MSNATSCSTPHPRIVSLALLAPLLALTSALLACPREGPADTKAPPAAVPPAAAAVMPSDAELTALLQRTLDHPRLAPYWHPELPERAPLRLVKNALAALARTLTLRGAAVEVRERGELEAKKVPYFEFRDLRPSADRVSIRFRYLVEGVEGEIVFKKQGGQWVEEKIDVAER